MQSQIIIIWYSFALLSTPNTNNNRNPIEPSQNYKQCIDYRGLTSHINKNLTWEFIYECENAERNFDVFYTTILNLISKYTNNIPSNTPNKYKKIKPWITSGINKSIRTRDKLARQAKREPLNRPIELILKYKKYSIVPGMGFNLY